MRLKNNIMECEYREYSHSGDLGDTVFSLATIKACGGADTMCLCNTPGRTTAPMSEDRFAVLAPLIEAQPYINRVVWSGSNVGSNLDGWRDHMRARGNILNAHAGTSGLPAEAVMFEPWLTCDVNKVADVVIARTCRTHGFNFPWVQLLDFLEDEGLTTVFLGLEYEHGDFEKFVGRKVPYHSTTDMLQAAKIINGAALYCGVQTALHAVAEGLGKAIIRECPNDGRLDNCNTRRGNLLSVYKDETFGRQWVRKAVKGELSYMPQRFRTAAHQGMPDDEVVLGFDWHHCNVMNDIYGNNPYAIESIVARVTSPSVIFDVGGYVGVTAAMFARRYPSARLVVFEPNPKWSELLYRNASRATVVPFAISSTEYPAYTEVGHDSGSNWAGQEPAVFKGGVPSLTFPQAVENHGVPDILKMDCEGGEFDVLPHLHAYPSIQCVVGEYHRSGFVDALANIGFDVESHHPYHATQGTFVAFRKPKT